VQTALLGVVLAAFTIRWRTLWPAIIAHAAVNMLSIVQLERLIAVVAPGS
jgi:membrane protease YdiL (CAAX protease family)